MVFQRMVGRLVDDAGLAAPRGHRLLPVDGGDAAEGGASKNADVEDEDFDAVWDSFG